MTRAKYLYKSSGCESFLVTVKDDKISFLKVNIDNDIPAITTSVTIKKDLSLNITSKDVVISLKVP